MTKMARKYNFQRNSGGCKDMKKHYFLLLLVIAGLVVGLLGCGNAKMELSKDLVVVEQTDTVYGGHEENSYCWAAITIDIPDNGPKVLIDSVMALVNESLYKFCELSVSYDDRVAAFSKEDVFTDDAKKVLSHYIEKYEPLIEDSLCNTHGIILKMEAQTEKLVTYGLEHFHCGASCGSEKYYHTFDKRDGHQVKEIISHDNLIRFFGDYPEYSTIGADPWAGEPGWKFSQENAFDNSSYGLLDDHFSLVIMGYGNHYMLTGFPYSQIFSYLSPETQALVEQKGEEEPMLPAFLPNRSEDGQFWMEVDTVNHALLGYVSAAGGPLVETLMHYEPELEIYPKRVHSIDGSDASTVILFIYSRGHLLYCDEALTCTIDENGLKPATLFSMEGERDSVISCMWYDQLVAASDGFPFEEVDEDRFGIHYDQFTKRLYYPIMENHEKDSGFENCLRYTGRYHVLQFNGKEFVYAGEDGAWWLNPDLRNYQRTISNRKTADGIEQIDLLPDSTFRRTFWKGAKTLDDLRKKPDKM